MLFLLRKSQNMFRCTVGPGCTVRPWETVHAVRFAAALTLRIYMNKNEQQVWARTSRDRNGGGGNLVST